MFEPIQDENAADGMSDMIESNAGIAASIHSINQQAVREYTPIVEAILCSRNHDKCHIEHTLDGLLDFCGYDSPCNSSVAYAATIGTSIPRQLHPISRRIERLGVPMRKRYERGSEGRV